MRLGIFVGSVLELERRNWSIVNFDSYFLIRAGFLFGVGDVLSLFDFLFLSSYEIGFLLW